MASPNDPFDPDAIQVLEGLSAVRRRPGMYLGSDPDEPAAIHNALWMVVASAFEEHVFAGSVTRIHIALDGVRATVEDDGRRFGTPAEPFASALGLVGNHRSDREVAFHGVGLATVNAVSSELTAEVWGDRRARVLRFLRGDALGPEVDAGPTTRTGTRIAFTPDFTILKQHAWDRSEILDRARTLAALAPGLAMIVDADEVRYPGGLADHVRYLAGGREIVEPFHCRATHDGLAVDVALAWLDRREAVVHGFVNFGVDDGAHVDALFVGLSAVIAPRLARDACAPIRAQLERGMIALVHVRRAAPRAGDEQLTAARAVVAVREVVAAAFAQHVVDAPAQLDALLQRLAAIETRRATIVRCPTCGATDAGEVPDKSMFEIRCMTCNACAHVEHVDDYQIKDDWNVEIDLPVDATALPAFVAPLA